jgi:hypothetical protein
MKVKDLIARLQSVDPEAVVVQWNEYYPIELDLRDVHTYSGLCYVKGSHLAVPEREFVMGAAISIGV